MAREVTLQSVYDPLSGIVVITDEPDDGSAPSEPGDGATGGRDVDQVARLYWRRCFSSMLVR